MESYRPPNHIPDPSSSDFKQWLSLEFQRVYKAAQSSSTGVFLSTQNQSPAKTNDGDLRLADGTNWDPGFGRQMLYWYSAADAEWKGVVHVGYGGTVTQSTDKTTAVELDTDTGQITMNNAALASATIVSFTLTNSRIAAGDVLVLNHVANGTIGAYSMTASCTSGSATIYIRNNTGGSLSQAVVLRFVRIPGATS